MKFKHFGFLALPAMLFVMSSCLSDDEEYSDYKEWRQENLTYFENAKAETVGGKPKYDQITPSWDKSFTILMQWHNDRSKTANNLSPLDNSTCNVKYITLTIKGDTIDSSYSRTEHGDSILQCMPSEMITGFWTAMTNMHIGDSVTAVVPYTAAYGILGQGSVLPFSTLVFGIKLESIPALETKPGRL